MALGRSRCMSWWIAAVSRFVPEGLQVITDEEGHGTQILPVLRL